MQLAQHDENGDCSIADRATKSIHGSNEGFYVLPPRRGGRLGGGVDWGGPGPPPTPPRAAGGGRLHLVPPVSWFVQPSLAPFVAGCDQQEGGERRTFDQPV